MNNRQISFTFLMVVHAVLFAGCGTPASVVAESDIRKIDGQTMGTYYVVTIVDPNAEFPDDWKLMVDAELRQVNDQMSTYLKSSEISRFNDSTSTEWFEVSTETAIVCQAAQEIANQTDGAFDCTVGPLVNLWNFGPGKRTARLPSDEEIAEASQIVGYQKLEVRLEPPAQKNRLRV